MKHTPWPLSIKPAGNGDHAIVMSDGVKNCIVAETFAAIRSSDEDASEEARANALLYAAAPLMLAALERACGQMEDEVDRRGDEDEEYDSPMADALHDVRVAIQMATSGPA